MDLQLLALVIAREAGDTQTTQGRFQQHQNVFISQV